MDIKHNANNNLLIEGRYNKWIQDIFINQQDCPHHQ